MLYTIESSFSLRGNGYCVKGPNGAIILRATRASWWHSNWSDDWNIADAAGAKLMELKSSQVTVPTARLLQNGQPVVTMKGRLLTGHTIEFHSTANYRVDFNALSRIAQFWQDDKIAACGQPVDFKLLTRYEVNIQPGYDPTFIMAVMLMVSLFSA